MNLQHFRLQIYQIIIFFKNFFTPIDEETFIKKKKIVMPKFLKFILIFENFFSNYTKWLKFIQEQNWSPILISSLNYTIHVRIHVISPWMLWFKKFNWRHKIFYGLGFEVFRSDLILIVRVLNFIKWVLGRFGFKFLNPLGFGFTPRFLNPTRLCI